jgi:hypothetical protein
MTAPSRHGLRAGNMPGRRETALSEINDPSHLVPEARSPQAQKQPAIHDGAGPEREKLADHSPATAAQKFVS